MSGALLSDDDEVLRPACWSWEVEDRDLEDARTCPEHFGHVLLWNWQRGQCAVCACRVDDHPPLIRDHDHETGLLRGLLCRRCNALEGVAKASSEREYREKNKKWRWGKSGDTQRLAQRFNRYRERSPAAILGLRVRHSMTQLSYGALTLPTQYQGDLPIFDVSPWLLLRFHKAVQVERGKDNRLPVLRQFMAWVADLPGAEFPERPNRPPARPESPEP